MKTLCSFSAGLLMIFGASTTVLADIIDNSLVLRFNFDAAPVANVIVDTSPAAGHPGTNLNTVWLSSEGTRNGVAQFTGQYSDRITVATNAALNSTTGTISFWMKSSGNSGRGDFAAILFDRRTSRGDLIALVDDGTIFVQARDADQNANTFSSNFMVNDGQWHHIAYVYDQSASGSISIFIDGVLDTTQPNSKAWGWPADQPIKLGSSDDSYWKVYDGVMDDFMVHDRMLTVSEIAATFAGNPVTDGSLVVRLNFDAAPVNNVVVDSSASGGNPGTNRGADWVPAEGGRNGLMRFAPPSFTQIAVAAHSDFNVSSGTIAFWMKSTGNVGLGDFGSILFDRRTGGNGDVIAMTDDGTIFVQAQGGGAGVNSFSTQGTVNDGQWHHVAYVYDQSGGGGITVYIDGAVSGSRTNSAPWAWPPSQPIELGLSDDPFWYGFDGTLDEVRFYNRALTTAEVIEIGVPPTLKFDVQPETQTVFVGDDVTLTARANLAASYRWKFGTNDISGVTTDTLILTNVQSINAGTYTAIASNALAQATSNPAMLVINPRPTLEQSQVARYNFDATPVNNVIVDTAPGGEHPGTNLLATWVADVTGRTGVMQFASANLGGQIVIPSHSDFDSSKGAIAFWMKSPGTGGAGAFGAILFDRRTDRGDVIVMEDNGTLFVQAREAGFNINSFATTNTVNDDQWHHIAYVYDQGVNGSTRIYVDGQLSGSKANSGPWSWDPAQAIALGKSPAAFWRRFDGYLDDVQFYNRVLTAAEVAQVMNPALQRPTLASNRSGSQLMFSWSASGFVLQENSDLGNPMGWTNVPGGAASPVTVTIPATGNKFYRLGPP